MANMTRFRHTLVVAFVAASSAAFLGLTPACGTDPVGVEACQKIEKVRCESAQACGISLTHPVHPGTSQKDNVAGCVRYYEDQCLHGLSIKKEPDTGSVDTCVNAIINGDCSIVKSPETHTECSFLAPERAADASADAIADAAPTD
jgi:hypothetical protein